MIQPQCLHPHHVESLVHDDHNEDRDNQERTIYRTLVDLEQKDENHSVQDGAQKDSPTELKKNSETLRGCVRFACGRLSPPSSPTSILPLVSSLEAEESFLLLRGLLHLLWLWLWW